MKDQRPFVLGLTGSIGMGKSATTQIFRENDVPVWDADATVHDMYQGDTPAVLGISRLAPQAVINQMVDRGILKQLIAKNPNLLRKIEALVHPLVAQSRAQFVSSAVQSGTSLIVIDNPLLFETKGDDICDAVLVVTASAQEQKRRVMARAGMTKDTFNFILSKQMPDAQKRARADYILETTTPEAAQEFVLHLIAEITGENANA